MAVSTADALARFTPAARGWFARSFAAPTEVQRRGWRHIAAGEHTLLIAPTGSGKTLAAFFWCIDALGARGDAEAPGVRVLYISPLKALVYDIERNLRAPLSGVARAAELAELRFAAPRVAVRTGDTPAAQRRAQARDPAQILVTTPESLYLILGSAQRETLRSVETIVVDEVHALAPSKRGAHLAISLERVAELCGPRDPQRIGLSATAAPPGEVARFLGGARPVAVVDASQRPSLDLRISVPVPDMTRPGDSLPPAGEAPPAPGEDPQASLWPAIYPKLLEEIRAHHSSILFVNSRGLCERLAQRLNDLAGEDLVRAHHGSISHEQRRHIEEALKAGSLRALVATSSLELGIDMGAVDLVLLVESPGAVSRGLQRVGRAGHQVGAASRGLVFPKHRGDLLEAAVVADGMRRGAVEPLNVPGNPLDVLAQQLVAMAAMDEWHIPALHALLRRSANFHTLSRALLHSVLDMLSGRYPSTGFADLRPRILWDRARDCIEARRGARSIALLSGGAIPDRGLYAVHMGERGPRIGELDEEMVHESRAGELITLGASSWRITEITRDRVVVAPAPGEPGKLPFWRGAGPGRPLSLGRALGAFLREFPERCRGADGAAFAGRESGEAWLREHHRLDDFAARNLVNYLAEQWQATGALPSDRSICIERFRDELGDWRICILSPFGGRLHAPWALAIESQLSRVHGFEVQALWNDDGISLRFADADELPGSDAFLPDPEELEERVLHQLEHSALFAGQFRESAARALLLPRRRPGARTPLWAQRLRAQSLLAVARGYPAFPITLEAYRSCLQDVFDLPGLVELLSAIRRREVRVEEMETSEPSPFARSLVFAWTAAFLYQGDAPLAERRASALALDRNMLRELLGREDLRGLLDAAAIAEVEAELQGRAAGRRALHADALHDLLRRLGDLDAEEVRARCGGDSARWLAELESAKRAVQVMLAGEPRWIAAEDAALYRDALGAAVPADLPRAFLETPQPGGATELLGQIVLRFARRRGPFTAAQAAARYALQPAEIEARLEELEARSQVRSGEFLPQGAGCEWCCPEVLRQLRRRSLARLRSEVAAAPAPALARFLPEWNGAAGPARGAARFDEALQQLEGAPLAFSDLESAILPARVRDFAPRILDEAGALGELVWVGADALGPRDGRIVLYRRERIGLLADSPEPPADLPGLARALLEHLSLRGACFFGEIAAALPQASHGELQGALWDLVWAGLITNDTFAPLRALQSRRPRPRARRPQIRRPQSPAAGRWSCVATLIATPASPTERAYARAVALLNRYGVVSRDVMSLEALRGGWSAIYPVLRAMEEAGKVRRGHFVEGYAGAQFALAGAVDRLRAARAANSARGEGPRESEAGVALLAAADPAQPFGALLPWPKAAAESARPRRAAGARVLLMDGELAAWLDRAGRKLWTFPGRAEPAPRAFQIASGLREIFRERRRTALRIEEIDGAAALRFPHAGEFVRAGFRMGYRALETERHGPPP